MSDNGTHGMFTTSKGITVEFVNIDPMLRRLNAQYRKKKAELVAPFYEVKTATGAIERFPHNDTTVSTPEEVAALADYRANLNEIEAAHQENIARLVFTYGIKYPEPESDEWIRRHKFVGIEVPDDPIERRWYYTITEVLDTNSAEDAKPIMLGVMEASGVPEEVICQVADSFRGPLGRAGRDATSGPAEATDTEGMVLQHTVRASVSGVQDGQIHERVGRKKRRG